MTITRAGPGTAAGYLTPAGGRAFGAALTRQAAADHGRASYGADGLFAHGLSVTLAGTRAQPRVRRTAAPAGRPQFVQHTLTVRATNLAGRPDDGDTVFVFNADNCKRFGDPAEASNVFRHGVTKFSVPAGHYWAFGDGQTGAFESPAAGQQTAEDWNRYPLHSGPTRVLTTAFPFAQAIPSASRAGNLVALTPVPFSDSQPGHIGSGLSRGARTHPSGRYALSADGRQIAAGKAPAGTVFAPVPAGPSLLRYTLTASRGGPAYPLSPASRTVWTWRSHRDPAARVPGSWTCLNRKGRQEIFTTRCAVQPMMTLGYMVPGLGLDGTAPAGPQVIDVTAGHLQLSRAAPVTGATAAVSFDGGAHWQPATVTRQGAGQFRVAFTAPPGALVTLRVSASDTIGGSVTESIARLPHRRG